MGMDDSTYVQCMRGGCADSTSDSASFRRLADVAPIRMVCYGVFRASYSVILPYTFIHIPSTEYKQRTIILG